MNEQKNAKKKEHEKTTKENDPQWREGQKIW